MRRILLALSVTAMIASSSSAEEGQGLQFGGLDTAAPIESNLDALNDIRQGDSPRFEQFYSGTLPSGDVSVMMGVNGGKIELLTAGIDGSFSANDRADIAAMERRFGLEGRERTIGECGEAGTDVESCTAVFYDCPEAPPICEIVVLSWGAGTDNEAGKTRVSWDANLIDLTVR